MRLRKDYGKIRLRQDGRTTEMGNKLWNPSFKCEVLTCREWAIIIYPMEGFLMFSLACFPIKECWCRVLKQLQHFSHLCYIAYIYYQWASRNVGRFYRTSNQTSATKTSITWIQCRAVQTVWTEVRRLSGDFHPYILFTISISYSCALSA